MRSLRRLAVALPAVLARRRAWRLRRRALASNLQAGGVAQSTAIDLSYDKCGSGNTHVQDVAQQPLETLGSSLAPTTFNARLVSEVSAADWMLTAPPKPDVNDVLCKIASDGLSGALLISDGPTSLSAYVTHLQRLLRCRVGGGPAECAEHLPLRPPRRLANLGKAAGMSRDLFR